MVKTGAAVIEVAYLYYTELEAAKNHSERWYRSKERKYNSYLTFTSYMLNKKWTLEEEFNNHMLRFQQVTVSSITSRN